MSAAALAPSPGLVRILDWRRLRFTLLAALPFGLMLNVNSGTTPLGIWIARAVVVGLGAMIAFGAMERWPRKLPDWLARWVWQLLGVVVAVPLSACVAYWVTTGGDIAFWRVPARLTGFTSLCFMGVLFAPWMALGAMVRQREAFARHQALAFELERSELERRALDARLRLMQAQVQPHFLFNTLANVRALVGTGSPRAPAVLDSLIAYLRAAVPRLDQGATSLGQEADLVRAYLELMHMRMPDRLEFGVHVDEAAASLRVPPMALLTLVENAVRHGIDPSEVGGRIDVTASVRDGRCVARVVDTGIGLQHRGDGLGTGLSTLRERMQLAFGGDAALRIARNVPNGVCAELEFPAQPGDA
jgi:hypothetical protein